MPDESSFDYAIVRVVPRVEREEFFNAGVILFCLKASFLDARVELAPQTLASFAPSADFESIAQHLAAIPRVCRGGADAGPVGQLPQKERWHWLVAPRSTVVQVGPVHSGLCAAPAAALEHLLDRMVRRR